jgi:hypothetical protein
MFLVPSFTPPVGEHARSESVDIAARVPAVLERHPAVTAVRLIGLRSQGTGRELSDWDFAVESSDFKAAARDLPMLVSPLEPLAQQWDRLSQLMTYMLMARGPSKIDLLFLDRPNEVKPPWSVTPETLRGIDDHFWDWILWVASKHSAGKHKLVNDELAKMVSHLLRPMGVEAVPGCVEEAIALYSSARRKQADRFGVVVPDALEREVRRGLQRAGYAV